MRKRTTAWHYHKEKATRKGMRDAFPGRHAEDVNACAAEGSADPVSRWTTTAARMLQVIRQVENKECSNKP